MIDRPLEKLGCGCWVAHGCRSLDPRFGLCETGEQRQKEIDDAKEALANRQRAGYLRAIAALHRHWDAYQRDGDPAHPQRGQAAPYHAAAALRAHGREG